MEIVSTCLVRDLAIYEMTYKSLLKYCPYSTINVITRRKDFKRFRDKCGSDLVLWDEDEMLPNMTYEDIGKFKIDFFPSGAGWYFQQFLKYAFAYKGDPNSDYVIWDADTVMLKPMHFKVDEKRIQTKATEHHLPYFETFENLLGFSANREFSFISQHQVINKHVLREMLKKIEDRFEGVDDWYWAILHGLKGEGTNLFSEYETYGHYEKEFYRTEVSYRELLWTRDGQKYASFPPKESELSEMRMHGYNYAAFENSVNPKKRILKKISKIFNW